ncbi:MAG: hypothetical protein Q8Q14_04235 [Gemmatimonadales bacterium]|nr:hypothetical protein [Gemmatimonadales bacterium]
MIRSGEGGDVSTTGNRYCERAGLSSVPRVQDVLARDEVNLFHAMVVALLERGGPMTVEQIAQRLTGAGAIAGSGDMVLSLKRAWHGRDPVYRDPDGRLGLNLSSSELDRMVWRVGLRPPRVSAPEPLPAPALPRDDVPLSEEEITAAFRDRSLYGFSAHRQAAAVLDARARPMTVGEVEGVLAGMTRHRGQLAADRVRSWRSPLVSLDESGQLRLDRGAPDLGAMRQAVRKLARPVLLQHARQEQWAKVRGEQETLLAEERRLQAQQAARLRRGVLRAVPEAEAPQAISLLDVGTRSIRTFVGSELAAVEGVLADLDLLAGLYVRETLHGLGLDPDRWRLVDLKPPQKSRRINRLGRTLAITPELLISSTTGISRPLGEPVRVAQYLAGGETGKLTRRLESDVKALHAFYRYGLLHHCVRLRWGFLDEMLPVDWALPGEPHLHEILEGAKAVGAPVDLVVGSAPGWADPWSRARRGAILEVEPWQVTVRLDTEVWRFDRGDIQAVRVVGGAGGT